MDELKAEKIVEYYVEILGLRFNPTQPACHYANTDGEPVFNCDQAAVYETDMNLLRNSVQGPEFWMLYGAWIAAGNLTPNLKVQMST